jgi:hypothetical protein
MAPVPHTGAFCSDLNWFAAMAWAAPDGEAAGMVYVLGILGQAVGRKKQVLARAPMGGLLSFDFAAWDFWCGEAQGWTKDVSCLQALLTEASGFLDGQTETTLHYHEALGAWVLPTADDPALSVWTAPHATGPWTQHDVADVPPLGKGWSFRTAKLHPELAGESELVVSVIPGSPDGVSREPETSYFPRLWRIALKSDDGAIAVFVSPRGDDASAGTRERPLRTVTAAPAAGARATRIYYSRYRSNM